MIRPAFVYFAIVFAAGFALGPARILLIAPRIGERAAEIAEAPVILAVAFFSARWITWRFAVPDRVPVRLGMGEIALALMLAAEFGLVLPLRGLTPRQYFATRDLASAAVYYASLLVFAVLPAVARRTPAKAR